MASATIFLRGHQPAGMTSQSSGQTGGPRGITSEETDYSEASLPAGIYNAELAVQVAPAGPDRSVLRATAEAGWYPRRTAAEYVRIAEIGAVTLSATTFKPSSRSSTRTFTAPSVIDQLARLLNEMHAAPQLVLPCPVELADYRLTFTASRGSPAALEMATGSCSTVTVTAHGRTQPTLADPGDGLAELAGKLLGVTPQGAGAGSTGAAITQTPSA
jgi:hypothetical protein